MKFKSTICVLALAATVISTASCRRVMSAFEKYDCESTGPVISRTTTLPAITGIHSKKGLRVTYVQCDTLSVTVNAPDDIMPLIETTVEDSVLTCSSTKNLNSCAEKVSITVKAPMVTSLEASSGSRIEVLTPYDAAGKGVSVSASSGASMAISQVRAKALTSKSSSGASLNVSKINVATVSAKASSGSSTHLNGKCNVAAFKASSGSSLDGTGLTAESGSAKASSGASLSCNIKNPNEIESSSGGSIWNNK